MGARGKSKVIATLLLGIATGVWIHGVGERRARAGRDAFMAEQANRWNRVYARPQSLAPSVIAGVGLCIIGVGLYEALAVGAYLVVRTISPDDPANR
jgi:hypothetical protein